MSILFGILSRILPLFAFGLTIKNPLVQRISRGASDCRCPAIRIPSGRLPGRLVRRHAALPAVHKFHAEVLPGAHSIGPDASSFLFLVFEFIYVVIGWCPKLIDGVTLPVSPILFYKSCTF